jgi:PAS domain S-box-containing protein
MLGLLVGNSVRLIEMPHGTPQAAARIQAIELAYKTAVAPAPGLPRLRHAARHPRRLAQVRRYALPGPSRTPAGAPWPPRVSPPRPPLPGPGPDPTADMPPCALRRRLPRARSTVTSSTGYSTDNIHTAKRQLLTQGSAHRPHRDRHDASVLLSLIGFWLTRHLTRTHGRQRPGRRGRLRQHAWKYRLTTRWRQLGEHFNRMAETVHRRASRPCRTASSVPGPSPTTPTAGRAGSPRTVRLRWVNPAVERVTGYAPEECHAMADYPLGLVIYGDDLDRGAPQPRAAACSGQTGQDQEFRIRRKDGRVIWVAMSWQPIFAEDGASPWATAPASATSPWSTTLKEELAYQASHDALTGLYNRRAFEAQLADGARQPCAQGGPGAQPAVHRPRSVQAGQRHLRPLRR